MRCIKETFLVLARKGVGRLGSELGYRICDPGSPDVLLHRSKGSTHDFTCKIKAEGKRSDLKENCLEPRRSFG